MSQSSTTQEVTGQPGMSAAVDVLAVLALVQAASPGPWEADTESNDAGFHSYVMTDANDGRLFDSLNADACVGTEHDDDGVHRWDVTAERNFKAAAGAVEFIRLHGAAIEDLRLKADNTERALRSLVAAGQAPAGYLQYADDLAAALRAVGGAR